MVFNNGHLLETPCGINSTPIAIGAKFQTVHIWYSTGLPDLIPFFVI